MVRKTVGYVNLEWTCPACGTVNKGTDAKCRACGAAMPEDIAFELRQGAKLDTSAETAARANAGADIICPYCGTRNPAGADKCKQCSGDFSDAERLASGQVLGAFEEGTAESITCPACGAENPANANNCSQCGASLAEARKLVHPTRPSAPETASSKPKRRPVLAFALIAAIVVAAFMFIGRCGQSNEIAATVTSTSWNYSIDIEGLIPVQATAWEDEIPAGAKVLSCEDRLQSTSEEPVQGAVEVCGTPYVVDTGTGVGQVVQDCIYEVYAPWCTYETTTWAIVDTVSTSGSSTPSGWPQPSLAVNQRLGSTSEAYGVVLNDGDETYTYTPDRLEEYLTFEPGQEYMLTVNGFGQIISID